MGGGQSISPTMEAGSTGGSDSGELHPEEKQHLDVHVSMLPSPANLFRLSRDLGLISATYAVQRISGTLATQTADQELARSMAIALLRAQAAKRGGNAVFNVRVEIERRSGQVFCTSMGAACLVEFPSDFTVYSGGRSVA
eukprot:TRINITY_DN11572_c0_g2_i2.p1 TRINITY_DN11572_c0_g2~~TRINITY_DN11572_c0_g2_i2.p1  ORF type:complete len:140 (-),score=15.89 TRINITY_DN11572_c0_g2_i2:105-524(-)